MRVLFSFVLIIFSNIVIAQPIVFVPEANTKGKVGLYLKGELVLKHQYNRIVCSERTAVAAKNRVYEVYNDKMQLLHSSQYDELISLEQTWVYFRKGNKVVIFDSGKEKMVTDINMIGGFEGSTRLVRNMQNKNGLFNADFEIIVPIEYDYFYREYYDPESFGLYSMMKDGVPYLFNANGVLVHTGSFSGIWNMRTEGVVCIGGTEPGQYRIFSHDGSVDVPMSIFKNPQDVNAGETPAFSKVLDYYVIKRINENGQWENALISKQGKMIYDYTANDLSYSCINFSCDPEQYYFVRIEGEYCLIADYQLSEIGKVKADRFIFSDGKEWVFEKENRLLFFDYKTFEPLQKSALKLEGNTVMGNQDGLYGIVDDSMNVMVPFKYPLIKKTTNDPNRQVYVFAENSNGPYGLMNKEGKILQPNIYADLQRYNSEFENIFILWMEKNRGKIAVLSEDGLTLRLIEDHEIEMQGMPKVIDGRLHLIQTDGQGIRCSSQGLIVYER